VAAPVAGQTPGCCGNNPAPGAVPTAALVTGGQPAIPGATNPSVAQPGQPPTTSATNPSGGQPGQPANPSATNPSTDGIRLPACDGNPPAGNVNCTPILTPRPERCPPGKEICTKINVPPTTGKLPSYDGGKTLYCKQTIKGKANIDVPVEVVFQQQTFKFGTITIPLPCCDVTICVPCEECWIPTKRCELRSLPQTLEFCIRYDDRIDVYALDVPGMPNRYLVHLGLTRDRFQQLFPNIQLP
jgi:hypothetical protein